MHGRGQKFYWYFDLANGTRRYWTNMSKENQKILGVYEDFNRGAKNDKQ